MRLSLSILQVKFHRTLELLVMDWQVRAYLVYVKSRASSDLTALFEVSFSGISRQGNVFHLSFGQFL